jgi:hypothetical protein
MININISNKEFTMHKYVFILIWLPLLLLACYPTAETVPTDTPNLSMIKSYTGFLSTTNSFTVWIPEIKGKQGTTFVMCYWAFSTVPDLWTPMADGWQDSGTSYIAAISWTYGNVYIYKPVANTWYLIQVFEEN